MMPLRSRPFFVSLGVSRRPLSSGLAWPNPVGRLSGQLRRGCAVWLLGLLLLLGTMGAVWAQGMAHPFGVPEAGGGGGAYAQGWMTQVSAWQSRFYRELTGAVRAWRDGGGGVLIWLSFAYGVFHALGPGHGKAVITAYVLANRQTVRNGAVLALLSALVQALVAIALVTLAVTVLQWGGATLTRATWWLELASFGCIVLLGAWLVCRHVLRPAWRWLRRNGRDRVHAHHVRGHDRASAHVAHHHGSALSHVAQEHAHDDGCGCGHAHVPPPSAVAGRLDWGQACSALMAVGLRPCSGAIIVLVFAYSQGLFRAGIWSALAMGLGTGLTVALLATLALLAGSFASRLCGGDGRRARLMYAWIQALAACAVFGLGLVLLGGAWLSAAPLGG